MLLAAHGERRTGADNAGVAQLAARLAEEGVAEEIGFGFLRGRPSIGEAVRRFASRDLTVYPLFLADGYFTQTLLPRQLEEAGAARFGRRLRFLPPLGLDPGLVDLILNRAIPAAPIAGATTGGAELVLLAHGSTGNPASRRATERITGQIAARGVFARVRPAFLEEPPYLADAVAASPAPIVVIGLFAGQGLHGGDVPRQIAELGRADVVFAGNIGGFEGLPAMVAAAIRRARPGVAAPPSI